MWRRRNGGTTNAHCVTTAITIAAACALAAGCGQSTHQSAENTPTTQMITSFPPTPLRQKTLPRLLLSPEQINAAMAAGEMTVTGTDSRMSDDSGTMAPRECLAVDGAAQAPVYADSGFTDEQEVSLSEPDVLAHYAKQAVVRFADAEQAKAFYNSSATTVAGVQALHPHADRHSVGRGTHLGPTAAC